MEAGVKRFYEGGGLAGMLGMKPWYEQNPTDIAQGFTGSSIGRVGPQLAAVINRNSARMAQAAKQKEVGPTIYHGSPHKWDWPAAGHELTGEGEAAYGRGIIYGGEAKGIGRTYQKTTSKTTTIPGAGSGGSQYVVRGAEFPTGREGHKALDTALDIDAVLYHRMTNPGGDMDRHLTGQIEARIGRWLDEKAATEAGGYSTGGIANEDMGKLVDFYERNVKGSKAADIMERPKGHLYEITLSRQGEDFLDWDKPLSEQSESVRKAIRGLTHDAKNPDYIPMGIPDDTPGFNIYQAIIDSAGSDEAASNVLREAGIPGIRYFDQMSRGAAGGELLGIEETSDGWVAKIKVENRGGVGFTAPTDIFTTSKPYGTKAEAERWAARKIGEGTRNYVLFDASSVHSVKRD